MAILHVFKLLRRMECGRLGFAKLLPGNQMTFRLAPAKISASVSQAHFHTSRIVSNQKSPSGNFHHPDDFEKKILVFSGMYKSKDKIPETVSYNTITKAKDWMRIRVSMMMMVFTAFCCVLIVAKGRKDRRDGDGLNKRGLKWQHDLQEQGRKEREEKAAKESEHT